MLCTFLSSLENSREAYEKAYELAKKLTKASHPIRLGLALNFSVFYYEIDKDKNKACELAKEVRVFYLIFVNFKMLQLSTC